MVQYFKVLVNEERSRFNNSVQRMQAEFKKSIIFHYHVINTDCHLFLMKRICSNKAQLKEMLINKGIFPISISNTKCNTKDKLYNVYFQSGSKIVVNHVININK